MKWDMSEEYLRVHKRAARRIYNMGGVIYLCPAKIRPGRPLFPEIEIHKEMGNFDEVVDMFAVLNCSESIGAYPAYYVERDLRNNVYESNG